MIAIIPARKGSKRLPGKNMMELCGKPLIYWTIAAAKCAFPKQQIIVSSDSNEILDYAKDNSVLGRQRPEEFATEDATTFDVVCDVMKYEDWQDDVMILQPTSPLRTSFDIDGVVALAKMGHTVTVLNNVISLSSFCENIYRPNGAIYVVKKADILQRNVQYQLAYFMPKERSVDIDTIEDFKEAERLMNERNKL